MLLIIAIVFTTENIAGCNFDVKILELESKEYEALLGQHKNHSKVDSDKKLYGKLYRLAKNVLRTRFAPYLETVTFNLNDIFLYSDFLNGNTYTYDIWIDNSFIGETINIMDFIKIKSKHIIPTEEINLDKVGSKDIISLIISPTTWMGKVRTKIVEDKVILGKDLCSYHYTKLDIEKPVVIDYINKINSELQVKPNIDLYKNVEVFLYTDLIDKTVTEYGYEFSFTANEIKQNEIHQTAIKDDITCILYDRDSIIIFENIATLKNYSVANRISILEVGKGFNRSITQLMIDSYVTLDKHIALYPGIVNSINKPKFYYTVNAVAYGETYFNEICFDNPFNTKKEETSNLGSEGDINPYPIKEEPKRLVYLKKGTNYNFLGVKDIENQKSTVTSYCLSGDSSAEGINKIVDYLNNVVDGVSKYPTGVISNYKNFIFTAKAVAFISTLGDFNNTPITFIPSTIVGFETN